MLKRDAKRYAYYLAAQILTEQCQAVATDVLEQGYSLEESEMIEEAMDEITASLRRSRLRLSSPGTKGEAAYKALLKG